MSAAASPLAALEARLLAPLARATSDAAARLGLRLDAEMDKAPDGLEAWTPAAESGTDSRASRGSGVLGVNGAAAAAPVPSDAATRRAPAPLPPDAAPMPPSAADAFGAAEAGRGAAALPRAPISQRPPSEALREHAAGGPTAPPLFGERRAAAEDGALAGLAAARPRAVPPQEATAAPLRLVPAAAALFGERLATPANASAPRAEANARAADAVVPAARLGTLPLASGVALAVPALPGTPAPPPPRPAAPTAEPTDAARPPGATQADRLAAPTGATAHATAAPMATPRMAPTGTAARASVARAGFLPVRPDTGPPAFASVANLSGASAGPYLPAPPGDHPAAPWDAPPVPSPPLHRAARALNPVFDLAAELAPRPAEGAPAPAVQNTFHVNVALGPDAPPASREALEDALAAILLDAARRQGLDL